MISLEKRIKLRKRGLVDAIATAEAVRKEFADMDDYAKAEDQENLILDLEAKLDVLNEVLPE